MNTHSSKAFAALLTVMVAGGNILSPLSALAQEASATAGSTATTAAVNLKDVDANILYKDDIEYLVGQKIVSGYPDGTYRPSITLNRAEMLKILVGATTKTPLDAYKLKGCFDDVAANEWFTPYVCYGKEKGWVVGYDNGKNFRPAQTVNTVEALKMTLQAFGISYLATSDVWYKGIVNAASEQNFIPYDVMSFEAGLRRDQMADLITRVLFKKENKLSSYLKDKEKLVVSYETMKAEKDVVVLAAEEAKKAEEEKKAAEDKKAAEAAAKLAEEAQKPGEPFVVMAPLNDTGIYVEIYDPYKEGDSPIEYYIVEQLVDGVYKPLAFSYKKDQTLNHFHIEGLTKSKTYSLKFTAVNKYNHKSKGETTFMILFGNTNTYPYFAADENEPDKPILYVTNQDNGTMTFKIEAPSETGGSPVIGYLMRKKEAGVHSPYKFIPLDSEKNNQYIFANLDPTLLLSYEFKTVTRNREVSGPVMIEFTAKKGGPVQIY